MPAGLSTSGFCAVLKQTSFSMLRPVPAKCVVAHFGGQIAGSARFSIHPLRDARSQATSSPRLAARTSSVTAMVTLQIV